MPIPAVLEGYLDEETGVILAQAILNATGSHHRIKSTTAYLPARALKRLRDHDLLGANYTHPMIRSSVWRRFYGREEELRAYIAEEIPREILTRYAEEYQLEAHERNLRSAPVVSRKRG